MATQLQEPVTTPDAVIADGMDEGQSAPRDYEAEARRHNWTSREEWDASGGDPDKWVDAETFVRRADEIMPLMRAQNKDLRHTVSKLERQVKKLTKMEQNAYENALNDLKAKQLEAFETGDRAAFEAANQQADEMRQKLAAPNTHGEDPAEIIDDFYDTNPWYLKGALASASELEASARVYADRLADKWIRAGIPDEIAPSEFYSRLEREVNARFPSLRQAPARAKPQSDVAGNTRPAPRSGAKTGANLPPEAKATAERYVRMNVPGYKGKSAAEAHNLFAQSWDWN